MQRIVSFQKQLLAVETEKKNKKTSTVLQINKAGLLWTGREMRTEKRKQSFVCKMDNSIVHPQQQRRRLFGSAPLHNKNLALGVTLLWADFNKAEASESRSKHYSNNKLNKALNERYT